MQKFYKMEKSNFQTKKCKYVNIIINYNLNYKLYFK